jgi:hypothetical protein
MMRCLVVLFCYAFLFPAAAAAGNLVCVPDRVCIPGNCDVPITDEMTLTLRHPDSMSPVLMRQGETIAMTKIIQHTNNSAWKSDDAPGEIEGFSLDRDSMAFWYTVGGELFVKPASYSASGTCSEQ